MPTQWSLDLAQPVELGPEARYDVLHAIACTFFEQPDSDHDAADKPFTARISWPRDTLAPGPRITLTWLGADEQPLPLVPDTVRVGHDEVAVAAVSTRTVPYATLEATPLTRRVRFTALSPTKFRQHGRDYPLPDPYLTYSTLSRRYRERRPDAVTDEHARELARTVVVYDHDTHTEPFTWHGRRSAGYVGTVTYGIPHTTPPPIRRLFTTLSAFANLAGLGHGTTHGLGATATLPIDPRQP